MENSASQQGAGMLWENRLGEAEIGSYLSFVVIDLMAGLGEGDVSAKGKGLHTERGNKPLGNALQTPWHPSAP